jgi:hypothetical protein
VESGMLYFQVESIKRPLSKNNVVGIDVMLV